MKSRECKRATSIMYIFIGITLFIVAIETEVWWQRATRVKSPSVIRESRIYMWKGLNEMCFHLPPNITRKCQTLKDSKSGDDWTSAVKYLMVAAITLATIELVVVCFLYVFTKHLFMDFIIIMSFLIVLIGSVGLIIYTERNPTHMNIFVLYGYSYACGWMGVCCFVASTIFSLLSRINEDGRSFLHTSQVQTIKWRFTTTRRK